MFEVLSKSNSAEITLNDNYGRALPAKWIIGRDARAVYKALTDYARLNKIDPADVGYSVKYED